MERYNSLLRDIAPDSLRGLEIGPLDKPLIARVPGRSIYYADYAHREALQEKSRSDPHVNVEAIPDIDFIISPLPQTLPVPFDYVIASHVLEHVPDLIGWLNTVLGWLAPGGRLVVAVPDKRYTFDILRPVSTFGQVLEAHAERRARPSFAQVYDGFSMAAKFESDEGWAGREPSGNLYYSREQALALAKAAASTYVDCHCWVFTYESFLNVLSEAMACAVLEAKLIWSAPPVRGTNEFHAALRRA